MYHVMGWQVLPQGIASQELWSSTEREGQILSPLRNNMAGGTQRRGPTSGRTSGRSSGRTPAKPAGRRTNAGRTSSKPAWPRGPRTTSQHRSRSSADAHSGFPDARGSERPGKRILSPAKKSVMFSLTAPEATEVAIAGSFNEWQPAPLTKSPDGTWRVTIQLSHGTYEYRFRVDGVWREDPSNLRRMANDVGGYNSVCNVL